MDLHISEASSLAIIDRQIEDSNRQLSPAEYEIIRRVIYQTADFEYNYLLKFSQDALIKGAAALIACKPIVVDSPAIQVSIVPRLQQTFHNSVYCCATTEGKSATEKTRVSSGLETLAFNHPEGIFIIGQDQTALTTLRELMENKIINPSLAIATAPVFIEQEAKQYFRNSAIPSIYIDSPKGSSMVASAIINSLVNLTWQAHQKDRG